MTSLQELLKSGIVLLVVSIVMLSRGIKGVTILARDIVMIVFLFFYLSRRLFYFFF